MDKYSLHITEWNSKSFLDIPKQLYSEHELPYISQPKTENLINCYVLKVSKKVVGRFALYHNPKVVIDTKKTISIGSYECIDDTEISRKLLQLAKAKAKEFGGSKLIGPMEGSTWKNYRFTVSNEPHFFTEMIHKLYYPQHFLASEFEVLKTYSSTLNSNIKVDEDRLLKFEERIKDQNIVIRTINLKKFKSELTKIANFSNHTFKANYLFSKFTAESFVEKYLPIQNLIREDLIYLVEDTKSQLQGFLFCIPNYFDKEKQSIIVKSMAILPKRELAGLGIYLGEIMYKKALELGYTKAIHAYMIDENKSIGLSNRFNAKKYKEHHLYICHL